MNATLKKVLAEFLGTFIFLLAIAGASASQSSLKQLSLALALGLAILTLGGISGGHFNPAVSIYFFARKELSFPEMLAYIAAQLTAAFFGVVSGLGLWGGAIAPLSSGNAVNSPVFLGEVVATAGLVFIIGTLVNNKQAHLIWIAVATWVFAAGTFTVTGAMANPAVAFGLMFNGISTGSVASIVVAQLVGLAAAILVLMITGAAVAKKAPAKKASIKFAPAPIVTTTAAKKPAAKKTAAKKPSAKKAPAKKTAAKKPVAKKAPVKK
jgi:arsenate reductase